MADLWNNESAIADLDDGPDVPPWIEQDISPSDVAAIVQGGCDSGAYMPAVSYQAARSVMNDHGDDVMNFLEEVNGEIPGAPEPISWDGMACHYLSCAVKLWAMLAHDKLEEILDD